MSIHLDSFSTTLGDLPKRDKTNMYRVLRVLQESGKFSTFEIDTVLAGTVTRLFMLGYIERLSQSAYPWVYMTVTAKGAEWNHSIWNRDRERVRQVVTAMPKPYLPPEPERERVRAFIHD